MGQIFSSKKGQGPDKDDKDDKGNKGNNSPTPKPPSPTPSLGPPQGPPPPSPTPPLNPNPPNSTPTTSPDPPANSVAPSLSTESLPPAASTENTTTGTATEASPIQSSLVSANGGSDSSQGSGTQIEPVSSTGSDSIFRTNDGEDTDPTLTPFSVPFGSPSTSPIGSPPVYLTKGVSPNGPSAPFQTSIEGGAAASPHNPAAIILGVLVPLFTLLLAAAGYIGYKRHRRLRDRRAWERTHEEIAVAVRDARPSVQPWVRFPDSPAPGALERGEETPAPAPAPASERDSVYSGIERESSFDGTSLYTAHDRKQ